MRNSKIKLLLLIALISLALSACGGAEERKNAYIEKADLSLASGDLDKARIELKNVLQIDPKDARAYFKLGSIFERKKEYKKAFSNYNMASELSPDNVEYLAKLGKFYLVLGGDVDKAKEKLNLIRTKSPDDAYGDLLEAGILLRSGKLEDAKKISEVLFNKYPENIENVIFLAALYSRSGEYHKASVLLRGTVNINPENQHLQLLLASSLYSENKPNETEEILKNLVTRYPDIYKNHVRLALFYQKQGAIDKGERVLNDAVSLDDKDFNRKIVLIEYIQKTQGIDAALLKATQISNSASENTEIHLLLGQLQLLSGREDQAINTFRYLIDNYSDEPVAIRARIALSGIYMKNNDTESAMTLIDEAVELSPNDAEINLLRAKLLITTKDYEAAINSLRTVIKDEPENIGAYFLLAASHSTLGEVDQAKDVIARAYENSRGNAKALLSVAEFYLKSKDIDNADKVVDEVIILEPENYKAISIKASIMNTEKKYEDASALSDKLIKLYPEKENGYIQKLSGLLNNDNYAAAIELLDKGYAATNGNEKILELLSTLLVRSGNIDKAESRLTDYLEKKSSDRLWLLLSRIHLADKEPEEAMNDLMMSIKNHPESIQSYLMAAQLYMKSRDTDNAMSIISKGLVINKDDSRLRIMKASIYDAIGKYEESISEYSKVLAANPKNVIAANNLASLLMQHYDDETSIARANELARGLAGIKVPEIMDTVGWVYYKKGDYENAVNILKEVQAAQPVVQLYNYHLGMSYFKLGDSENAKKYLTIALNTETDFPGRKAAIEILSKI